jgi:pimeloyl-ACP methyl ester carboxylesterase
VAVKVAHESIGSGPPVLLVSGLSQRGARWRRVAERLAKPGPAHPLGSDPRTFTVVTVDNRETGDTGPSPDGAPFTLTDVAHDHLDLMTSLGHHRFFLAGISMGGMIAQEIVRAAPERVRACGLFATHGGGETALPPPDTSVLMPSKPVVDEASRLDAGRELWTRLSGPGFAQAHPDIIEEEARLSVEKPTPLDGVIRQMQAIFAFDPGTELVGVLGARVPMVLGHGDCDPLVPYENGVILSQRLGVDLVTFTGAGHALEFERPDEVATLLRQLFAASLDTR